MVGNLGLVHVCGYNFGTNNSDADASFSISDMKV